MPRPQFTLKTILWLMLVVAAFFGGAEWHKRLGKPAFTVFRGFSMGTLGSNSRIDRLVQSDGTQWIRIVYTGTPPTHEWRGDNGEIVSVRIKPAPKQQ